MSDLTADSGKLQLMAEIERLRFRLAEYAAQDEGHIIAMEAEIERLREVFQEAVGEVEARDAEIERLKAALRLTCTVPLPDRIYQAVAAALEEKP